MSSVVNILGLTAAALLLSQAIAAEEGHPAHPRELARRSDVSLSQLVELVWQRYPDAGQVEARAEEAAILRSRGRSLLAGNPSIEARYQKGSDEDDRLKEYEAGLDLPLWRWGQRKAGGQVARAADSEAASFAAVGRWKLAGALRDGLWAIGIAENRMRQAELGLANAVALDKAVRRRVEVGDLPDSDALQTEKAVIEAQMAVLEADGARVDALRAYQLLTADVIAPADVTEARSERRAIDENHPALAQSLASWRRAESEYEFARQTGGGQPSVLLGTRRERSADAENFEDSVGVSLRIPIGTSHSGSDIAAARVEAAAARSAYRTEQIAIEREFHEAEHTLDILGHRMELSRERADRARRHHEVSQKAFEAGEIDLADLLRIRDAAQSAETDAREGELLWHYAIARYNQAVGDIP